MKCSLESVRCVVERFLQLEHTEYAFHQTLTFRGEMTDRAVAKANLEKLLNVLHKQFEMISLFVEEGHSARRIHYHVLFLFYPDASQESPQDLMRDFGAKLFEHWLRITGQNLNLNGNRISLRPDRLRILKYFLGEAIVSETTREPKELWHGQRNKKLIAAHSREVSTQEIREVVKLCCPTAYAKPLTAPEPNWRQEYGAEYYDPAKLRELRRKVESKGVLWRKHKDKLTGRKNCTDAYFIGCLNRTIDAKINLL